MNSPRTWQLLKTFQACLEQIRIGHGYLTDAGGNVTLEPAQEPEDSRAVLCVLMGAVARPENPAMAHIGRAVTVVILAKVSASTEEAQEALHKVLDDIDRCIASKAVKFPAQISYPQFVSSQPIPSADGVNWVGAEIRYQANVIPLTR